MTRSQTERVADAQKAFGAKGSRQVLEAMSLAGGHIKKRDGIDVVDLVEAAEFLRRMGYRQAAVLLTEFAAQVSQDLGAGGE